MALSMCCCLKLRQRWRAVHDINLVSDREQRESALALFSEVPCLNERMTVQSQTRKHQHVNET